MGRKQIGHIAPFRTRNGRRCGGARRFKIWPNGSWIGVAAYLYTKNATARDKEIVITPTMIDLFQPTSTAEFVVTIELALCEPKWFPSPCQEAATAEVPVWDGSRSNLKLPFE